MRSSGMLVVMLLVLGIFLRESSGSPVSRKILRGICRGCVHTTPDTPPSDDGGDDGGGGGGGGCFPGELPSRGPNISAQRSFTACTLDRGEAYAKCRAGWTIAD